MLRPMASHRILIGIEFQSPAGFRITFDAEGWRLLNPRQLGQADLERARALVEQAEVCLPPVLEDEIEPPSMNTIGEHVATTLGLRITHHRFKQRR